jgi:DNA-binding MarR family transcriptional regulator
MAFLLHDIARQMRHTFDLQARDLGVTRQQWRALLTLARNDGLTQTELADLLEVERISVGRMVDRLVENGLVERRADPADRRVWRLHLLPLSHDLVNKLSAIGASLEADVLAGIPMDKHDEFRATLVQLREELRRIRADLECQRNVA